MAEFQINAFHNEFLARGARTVHALVTVTASGTGSVDASAGAGQPTSVPSCSSSTPPDP